MPRRLLRRTHNRQSWSDRMLNLKLSLRVPRLASPRKALRPVGRLISSGEPQKVVALLRKPAATEPGCHLRRQKLLRAGQIEVEQARNGDADCCNPGVKQEKQDDSKTHYDSAKQKKENYS